MKGFEPYTGASPMKWDWGKALDRVQTGLTAAGMVPGLGNLADMAGAGLAVGSAKLASKGVQKGAEVLKTGSKVAKKVKKVKKGKEVAKDVKKEIEDPNRAKTSNLGGYGKA